MPNEAKLPPAVQRSVDAANADARKVGMRNVPALEPAQASPDALQAGLEAPVPTPAEPAQPQPAAEQPQAPDPAAEPAPSPAPDNVTPIDWERRYKAMKGQYDAEVPRLKAEMDNMRAQVASMQASLSQPPAPAGEAAPQPADKGWYTDEQLEDFGQDFFDLVDKRVKLVEDQYSGVLDKVQKENTQLKAQIQELNNGVQQVQKQPMYTVLDNKVPGWAQLNTDPAFIQWAKETPVSELDERPMIDALRAQFSAGRIDPVVKIFQAYQNQQGQGPRGSAHQQPVGTEPSNVPGRQPAAQIASPPPVADARQPISMESLAGPGAPQEPGTDQLAAKQYRTWTDASIAQFYDAVRRRQIPPADAKALEADLQIAISPQGMAAGRYKPR